MNSRVPAASAARVWRIRSRQAVALRAEAQPRQQTKPVADTDEPQPAHGCAGQATEYARTMRGQPSHEMHRERQFAKAVCDHEGDLRRILEIGPAIGGKVGMRHHAEVHGIAEFAQDGRRGGPDAVAARLVCARPGAETGSDRLGQRGTVSAVRWRRADCRDRNGGRRPAPRREDLPRDADVPRSRTGLPPRSYPEQPPPRACWRRGSQRHMSAPVRANRIHFVREVASRCW